MEGVTGSIPVPPTRFPRNDHDDGATISYWSGFSSVSRNGFRKTLRHEYGGTTELATTQIS